MKKVTGREFREKGRITGKENDWEKGETRGEEEKEVRV